MMEQLTLLPEAILASRSAPPGSDMAREMTAISGQLCSASSRNTGPLGSLEKMLLGTSAWGSTMCFLTWKVLATSQGRLIFRLVQSEPITSATGFGFWLTPRAQESGEKSETFVKRMGDRGEHCFSSLTAQVKFWPTPNAGLGKQSYSENSKAYYQKRIADGRQTDLALAMFHAMGSGQLNPPFVEWLMGFPTGWTELKP